MSRGTQDQNGHEGGGERTHERNRDDPVTCFSTERLVDHASLFLKNQEAKSYDVV